MATASETGAAGGNAGRTFVILNPAAGQDRTERLRRRVEAAFARHGAAIDLALTAGPGHATELARDAADRAFRAVTVVGGDGTLAEVLTGLVGTGVPAAVVPRGTGNQVARNLQIPTRLDDAVGVAVHGRATPVDLGRVDGRVFALAVGAGFDAAVMRRATRQLKARWGFLAYLYAMLRESMTARPAWFRLRIDGRVVETPALSVLVANVGELFAGALPVGLPLSPHDTCSWQDGVFDVIVIAPARAGGLGAVFWNAIRRRFDVDPRLRHFQAREVRIEADPIVPLEIDGDAAGTTPVTAIVVERGALILTPVPGPADGPAPGRRARFRPGGARSR